jgi:hypothetical protein
MICVRTNIRNITIISMLEIISYLSSYVGKKKWNILLYSFQIASVVIITVET